MFKKLPTPIILCLYLFSCSIIPIPFAHNSKKEKEKKTTIKNTKSYILHGKNSCTFIFIYLRTLFTKLLSNFVTFFLHANIVMFDFVTYL